jgi:MFS family permease
MAAAASTVMRDTKVLGLIGAGHMMSHLFHYTLPPLFPFIRAEYALSYTQLGLLMTVFAGSAAAAQMPVGVLVDRIGARAILIVGLALEGSALGAMAFSDSYPMLLTLACLAGLGHSVFHPADYAIMLSTIEESRMGRAFSIHGISGRIGGAIAPAATIALTAFWGWKGAILTIACVGLLITLAIASQAHNLRDHTSRPEKDKDMAKTNGETRPPTPYTRDLRLLLSAPILTMFFFFLVTTMSTNGTQTFLIVALGEIHNTPVEAAAAALTGFLIAGAFGGLIGGWVADHTTRHNVIATVAFSVVAAGMILIGEINLPVAALTFVMVVTGTLHGMVQPARDMMVKAIMPPGAAGRLFAFMSMGRLLGATIAPIIIGLLMDNGGTDYLFWMLAGFALIGLATLNAPRRKPA